MGAPASTTVVSRQLMKKANGNVTVFAFDAGQELTEHTSPFEALIEIVEGDADSPFRPAARRR